MAVGAVRITPIAPDQLPDLVPALSEILIETVGLGASVGFLAPLSFEEAASVARQDRLESGARPFRALQITRQAPLSGF